MRMLQVTSGSVVSNSKFCVQFPNTGTEMPPVYSSESAVWNECCYEFYHRLVRNACTPAEKMACGRTINVASHGYLLVPKRAFDGYSWRARALIDHQQRTESKKFGGRGPRARRRKGLARPRPNRYLTRFNTVNPFAVALHVFPISLYTVTARNGSYESDCISKVGYMAWRSHTEQ